MFVHRYNQSKIQLYGCLKPRVVLWPQIHQTVIHVKCLRWSYICGRWNIRKHISDYNLCGGDCLKEVATQRGLCLGLMTCFNCISCHAFQMTISRVDDNSQRGVIMHMAPHDEWAKANHAKFAQYWSSCGYFINFIGHTF